MSVVPSVTVLNREGRWVWLVCFPCRNVEIPDIPFESFALGYCDGCFDSFASLTSNNAARND